MAKKTYGDNDPFARHENESEAVSAALYGRPNIPDTGRPTWRDGALNIGAFRCTATGISLPENVVPTDRDMRTLGETLRYMQGSLQWLIGDFAITAEHLRWGDLPVIAESLGLEYGTLRTYMTVCRSVHLSIRIDNLTFAHHQLVASLPPDQQREALAYALENKLSVAAFRAWLNPKRQLPAQDDGPDYQAAVRDVRKLLALPALTARQRRQLSDSARQLAELLDDVRRKLNATRPER